ncbi:hypothetical protein J460_0176 [Acinetobacter baumannii 942133]|uniref:Uncharacterized protein n=2 Tax=Escherichia coli TaxID=562 RepID=A0A4P8G9B3_ECOLX|nr:hypothetical protein J460_0176 [Acinetobacter baumannii 942133]QCF28680.1 hypothetical protein [Escherichia coli J53]QCO89621.1 hypothetical protein [Escherichia coli]URQ57601.1 Hypothetical protein [Providencia rettgeri]CCG28646.1 hypothetical protein [Klebsiella aerogenes EA1509E]
MYAKASKSSPFEETLRQLSIPEGGRYRAGPWAIRRHHQRHR